MFLRHLMIFVVFCGCGNTTQSNRSDGGDLQNQCLQIVNGIESEAHEEVVFIGTEDRVCSGVFISDRALLTAAHCIPDDVTTLRYLKGGRIEDFNNSYFLGVPAKEAIKGAQGKNSESIEGSNDVALVLFPEKTSSSFASATFYHPDLNVDLVGFGLSNLSGQDEAVKIRRSGVATLNKKSGTNGIYFSNISQALAAGGDSGGGVFVGNALIGIISGTRSLETGGAETFAVDLSDEQTKNFIESAAAQLKVEISASHCR